MSHVPPRTRRRVLRAVTLVLGGAAIAGVLAAGQLRRERDQLRLERDQLQRARDAALASVEGARAEQVELEARSRAALRTVGEETARQRRRWTRALARAGLRAATAERWGAAAVLLTAALVRREDPHVRFEAARAVGRALAAPVHTAVALPLPTSLRSLTSRGDRLAGVGRDERVWRTAASGGWTATRLDARGGLTFLHDGRLAAAGPAGALRLGEDAFAAGPALPHPAGSGITALAGAPREPLLATGDREGAVRVWRLPDGKLTRLLESDQGWVLALAFDEAGRLAAAGRDGTVRLYVGRDPVATLRGHARWARSLAFAPGGRLLAVGDGSGAVHVWETRRRLRLVVLRGHRGGVVGLAWRAGRLLSLGGDGTLLSWDAVAFLAPAGDLAARAAETGLRLDGLQVVSASGGTEPGGSRR